MKINTAKVPTRGMNVKAKAFTPNMKKSSKEGRDFKEQEGYDF